MNQQIPIADDEIDLIELIQQLYRKRSFIFKTTLVFVFVGLLVALFSPELYKAQAIFVVQNSDKQVSSSISGLAALAGVNLQSEAMGDIPPSLYPNIVGGIPFKMDLIHSKIDDGGLTYKNYLLDQSETFGSQLKKYTFGLPSLLLSLIRNKDEIPVKSNNTYNELNESDYELTQTIEELIRVEVNQKEGFITLSALDKNPKYAAKLTSTALKLLQDFITNYKTENAKRILSYIETQYNLKQEQYDQIQKELAEFNDQNKNISTAVFESNRQKLQTRHDLIYSVYLELSKQLEQAKLQVSKEIPNISIIEPVYVPNKREQPKRALILLIYTFLGGVLSCGWVLVSKPFMAITKQIKN